LSNFRTLDKLKLFFLWWSGNDQRRSRSFLNDDLLRLLPDDDGRRWFRTRIVIYRSCVSFEVIATVKVPLVPYFTLWWSLVAASLRLSFSLENSDLSTLWDRFRFSFSLHDSDLSTLWYWFRFSFSFSLDDSDLSSFWNRFRLWSSLTANNDSILRIGSSVTTSLRATITSASYDGDPLLPLGFLITGYDILFASGIWSLTRFWSKMAPST
jgi:hypothetical protein